MTATDEHGRLIVLTGPTGVGKTDAAIRLAAALGGEIVNADSRYLYRGFDIGVAKPTLAEREIVPHHLIDILAPEGEMSLSTFQRLAIDTIRDVQARGRIPLLVGGTVLYINAVVEGWNIPEVAPDPAFRAEAEARAAVDGGASLRAELARIDPVVAERSGRNTRRVIRALEIHRATGVPMSELEGRGAPPFRSKVFGLRMPREALHRRLDQRVARLIEQGLVEEVRGLVQAGVPSDAPAMSSIGYRQLLPYLRGEATLAECVTRIEVDTHRYVRHQETWLRKATAIERIDVTEAEWEDLLLASARAFLGEGAARVGA